jgi:translation initiation factor IF-2
VPLKLSNTSLSKFSSERINVRVIDTGVGDITANDVQNVSATKNAIIVGFTVKAERQAVDLAERLGVEINTFDIIYELSDWLNTALKNRTPQMEEMVFTGKVKILKHFSTQKNTHVIGARVEEGYIKMNQKVKITRRDIESVKVPSRTCNNKNLMYKRSTRVNLVCNSKLRPKLLQEIIWNLMIL